MDASNLKGCPHPRQVRVTVSTGRYFARHSWQQSGQCCTVSGRANVLPHSLHDLVIIPGLCSGRSVADAGSIPYRLTRSSIVAISYLRLMS
jgi:hypothetical protein